jgi:hypothetical protein
MRVLLLLVLLLGGCSAGLEARLVTPVDVELSWAPAPADGQVLEFATAPDGEWTVLGFLPPGQNSYRHPDLMPDTTFYYRVRPLIGDASEPVEVHLAGAVLPAADTDLGWAEPRTITDPPAALTATPKAPDAVLLTWPGTADDEDGQLIESRPEGETQWTVAMALDPGVNSAGLATERRTSVRVRPFRFGESSGVAHRRTGH